MIPWEDLDDEDDDDDGDVREKLVEAGAKVADDGSLVLDGDSSTIVVLDGDTAAAAGVGGADDDDDQDRLQDQGARDAAAQSLWDTVERRFSTRLAAGRYTEGHMASCIAALHACSPSVHWHHEPPFP